MSNINKKAREKLKLAAAKAADNFDPNMFVESRDVLALLDELEASDALNKHLELAIRKAEGCSEALRRKTEAKDKRIAELEAREVRLPEVEKWRSPEAVRAQNAYRVLVGQELSTAGISINGE